MKILGTEYELLTDNSIIKRDADGECSIYEKTIRIRPIVSMLGDEDSIQNKQKRYNEVLRHEIIHAFLFESGMDAWCSDERLVQYLAVQFPKLIELFNEHTCIK